MPADASGSIYVADEYNHRVQKFGSNGSFITKWGELGIGDGEFYYPEGIATDSTGNVYVADTSNERVQKFGSDGTFITKWDVRDSYGDLESPSDVAVDSSGNVFVSAYDSVYKFGADNGAAPTISPLFWTEKEPTRCCWQQIESSCNLLVVQTWVPLRWHCSRLPYTRRMA